MIASEILTPMGSTTASISNGPVNLSANCPRLSAKIERIYNSVKLLEIFPLVKVFARPSYFSTTLMFLGRRWILHALVNYSRVVVGTKKQSKDIISMIKGTSRCFRFRFALMVTFHSIWKSNPVWESNPRLLANSKMANFWFLCNSSQSLIFNWSIIV